MSPSRRPTSSETLDRSSYCRTPTPAQAHGTASLESRSAGPHLIRRRLLRLPSLLPSRRCTAFAKPTVFQSTSSRDRYRPQPAAILRSPQRRGDRVPRYSTSTPTAGGRSAERRPQVGFHGQSKIATSSKLPPEGLVLAPRASAAGSSCCRRRDHGRPAFGTPRSWQQSQSHQLSSISAPSRPP